MLATWLLAPHPTSLITHLCISFRCRRAPGSFWTDIYEGCKLFYLSGIKHGRYPKAEVSNLARFISVLNFRPLIWRNSHPSVSARKAEVTHTFVLAFRHFWDLQPFHAHPRKRAAGESNVHCFVLRLAQVLADRVEDTTAPELLQDPTTPRQVSRAKRPSVA